MVALGRAIKSGFVTCKDLLAGFRLRSTVSSFRVYMARRAYIKNYTGSWDVFKYPFICRWGRKKVPYVCTNVTTCVYLYLMNNEFKYLISNGVK